MIEGQTHHTMYGVLTQDDVIYAGLHDDELTAIETAVSVWQNTGEDNDADTWSDMKDAGFWLSKFSCVTAVQHD